MRQFTLILLILSFITSGCKKDEGPTGPEALSINGYVKDFSGKPLNNILIVIQGKTPVTSDGNGAFSIPNVMPPYDIAAIYSAQKSVTIYKGLHRPDPKLRIEYTWLLPPPIAVFGWIKGNVPISYGKTRVFFVNGTDYWETEADWTTGEYTIHLNTFSITSDTLSGKLYVLRYTAGADGNPLAFDGYGVKNLTITAGDTSKGNNFSNTDLTDPTETNITGSVVKPQNVTSYNLGLYAIFDSTYFYISSKSYATSDAFAFTVPVISGVKFAIAISPNPFYAAGWFRKTNIESGTSNVILKLESPPRLTTPADNTTNVDTSTIFTWTQGGGEGVNVVKYFNQNIWEGPSYYIYTTASNISIPNLSAYGLGLPRDTNYVWLVSRYYPVSSIDNAASDTFLKILRDRRSDFGESHSGRFHFRTKP
ncbi:MAG: carboxypeptidase-like regulatory domain-containing protein [Bacteroidota bacterium]|nr:carboxypeptidase-like regulatory domain-containing protein [Bacteroidota bacterium]